MNLKRERKAMSELITFKQYGKQQNWVDGKVYGPSSKKNISVISPYYDKEIAVISDSNAEDLNQAVINAKNVFPDWAATNIRDRAEVMYNLKSIMKNDIEQLAHLVALDNGKT
ncbi:MAG: aldehyde dehydrogenase family protein, partial [Candidatus Marinimicrobia bacterium]|nr:aldehyde dehydrogenase family protein [Candidatus Neomarinimicrobiota bacterium]